MGSGGAEPSGKNHLVQAHSAMSRGFTLFAVLAPLLSGCAGASKSLNPVAWWHDIEGGSVAGPHQSVPGERAPYPNLADVPKAPAFTPAPERESISSTLLADRSRAHQEMLLAPIAPPVKPAAPLPATVTPASASSGQASAALPAAAPPPAASAPAAIPEPPAIAPATAAAGLALLSSIPTAPPPPPAIAGFAPPGLPPAPLAVPTPHRIALSFAPGSSVLSAADRARLVTLATARRNSAIAVEGYGGAASSGADAQAAALQLALARAEVVAAALAAAGVPPRALSLGAQASGNGATAHLAGGA